MKQKINVRLIGIAILAVLATLVCMTCVYYSLFQKQVRKDLKIQAQMLGEAEVFDDVSTPAKSFDIAKEDLRITWIDKDGTVLYDNDANTDKLENHADRPEVKSAFLTGDGECVRNSNTMNMTTFYYALLLDNGTVLRVATQARSIWSVFLTAAPMIATILVLIIVICVFLAHLLTGQLLQPIEVMAENMEDTSKVPAYKELVPFVNTIRAQHENILMAAKVRQDFTANVSHELKTPLTAISGYAELIENHMVDPAQETHFAKEIQQNANRLLSLINDIIRLSELDNSENLIHYEQVDLNASAQECVSNLTVNAEKRGIQLFYEGEIKCLLQHIAIFPASHYVVPQEKMNAACARIEVELEERVKYFKGEDKLLEAQRIAERTNFDIEMMKETGFCSGIENYSRHLAGRAEGEMPETLIDYFPDDFLIIVDESHITIPQVRGMYAGDRSRKTTLVDYGFRLPSALDNRPLNFEEFESKIDQMLFVSATPNVYEQEHELLRVEQIIRPTGLLDPEISVRPVEGQIDDLIGEVNKETKNHHKVLITTLTKRMAEDLTQYMGELGIRVKYLHSDIDTLERAEIIRDLRLDVFDVLVGINLLREGLDIPEITLVAILDADKEGFLRSETSLIQTIGRAARNSEGHVIMYADKITDSMRVAIDETKRRREVQQQYNEEHGITPTTIQKSVRDLIAISKKVAAEEMEFDKDPESMSRKELEKLIGDIQKKMKKAAAELNFEAAAEYRDKMVTLKNMLREID